MSEPIVSVLCATYNQEKYIAQAVESFLMQQTDFTVEILINNDASTDRTGEILDQYCKQYPERLSVITQHENQYCKGVAPLRQILFPLARGKYIALCDGDDYWTDPLKLQKQVDFMETNPNCSLCFHPALNHHEDGSKEDTIWPDWTNDYTLNTLLSNNFIQTCSVVYRRLDYSGFVHEQVLPGDWYLHLYHARFGAIGFIDEVMSLYRINRGSVWYHRATERDPDFILGNTIGRLRFIFAIQDLFPEAEYQEMIEAYSAWLFKEVDYALKKSGEDSYKFLITDHTQEFLTRLVRLLAATAVSRMQHWENLHSAYCEIQKAYDNLQAAYDGLSTAYCEQQNAYLQRSCDELTAQNSLLTDRLTQTVDELERIKQSRAWRMVVRLRGLLRRT